MSTNPNTVLFMRTFELDMKEGRFANFSQDVQPYGVEIRQPWVWPNDPDLSDLLDIVQEIETTAWTLVCRKASPGPTIDDDDEMIIQVSFAELEAATHFKLLW